VAREYLLKVSNGRLMTQHSLTSKLYEWLRETWDSYGDNYEEYHPPRCDAV